METLADRLKITLKERKVTQAALAKALNVNPQQIQAVCSGKIQRPTNVVEMSAFLGVSPFWLQQGKGPRHLRVEDSALRPSDKIPLMSWEAIGAPNHNAQMIWLNSPTPVSDKGFALRVQGYGMLGKEQIFKPGSIIIVDPDMKPADICYVIVNIDGIPHLRQLTYEGAVQYLHILNPKYPDPIQKLSNQNDIIGVVVGVYYELI